MKYKCLVNYLEFYKETEIEADSADEAQEKYQQLVDDGMIESVGGEYEGAQVEEVS